MTEEFDDEERRLCPDGACIGILGDDGRCKVCGRADDGSEPPPRAAVLTPLPGVDPGDEPFDEDRQLCPDDACIGLIGSDGVCRVCGRSAGS